MDPKLYKELHELFMQNNNGTTITEAFVTTATTFFTSFLTINLLTVSDLVDLHGRFLLEFLLVVVSFILNVTVLNFKIWEVASSLALVGVTAAAKQLWYRTHLLPFVQIPSRRPEYFALLRATINLVTAVCILAVDFKCFPRKLAKTETFGFGLMDLGVGLYVYSNAIVSPELKSIQPLSGGRLQKILLNSSPLLLLGFARFFIINEIDYQQHVSEYGVHWNFFMTLAITKVFGSILTSLLRHPKNTKYAAIVLVIGHEMLLQWGLAKYVTSESVERTTFIDANREGICSIPGYISLYLACIYVGSILRQEEDTINARVLLKAALKMFLLSLFLWKIVYVCEDMFGVSRRMANMGYVIWVLSIGTTMTTLFMLLEVFYYFIAFEKPRAAEEVVSASDNIKSTTYLPLILGAINYNGLGFFLGANILTGLINLTFQTLLIEKAGCLFILIAYMFVLCSIFTFFYIKQWLQCTLPALPAKAVRDVKSLNCISPFKSHKSISEVLRRDDLEYGIIIKF